MEIDLNAEVLCNKGISLAVLERNDEALECYDKAIQMDPNDEFAFYNKGVLLTDMNRSEEALECYDKVLEIEPDDADALYNKGTILSELGKNEEAEKCFTQVKELESSELIIIIYDIKNSFSFLIYRRYFTSITINIPSIC